MSFEVEPAMPEARFARRSRRRLAVVVALTLLPWPAVWLGLYRLDSLFWTFALYHGLCLLPAAWWGRRLWWRGQRAQPSREWIALALAAAVVMPASVVVFHEIGDRLVDPVALVTVLTARGFTTHMLLPLALYFVVVNAALEEVFWRGVILEELRGVDRRTVEVGALWTAFAFGAWHFVVIRLLLRPGWAELTVIAIMAAGLFLDWVYRRTGNLLLAIGWHALVFDLPIIAVFAAVLRQT